MILTLAHFTNEFNDSTFHREHIKQLHFAHAVLQFVIFYIGLFVKYLPWKICFQDYTLSWLCMFIYQYKLAILNTKDIHILIFCNLIRHESYDYVYFTYCLYHSYHVMYLGFCEYKSMIIFNISICFVNPLFWKKVVLCFRKFWRYIFVFLF